MANKKIKLMSANFRSGSIKMGAEPMTSITVSASFDQLIADQLGVKERVYGRKKDAEDADVDGFELGVEWYGAMLSITPKQARTDKQININKAINVRALKLWGIVIRHHKDDEQMLISFKFMVIDSDGTIHGLIHSLRKDPFDLDVTPPTKKAAEEASDQLKLISKDQADATAEESD